MAFTAANYPAPAVNPFPTPAGQLPAFKGMTWVCCRQYGLTVWTGDNDFRFSPGDWVQVPTYRVNELRAEQMIY